MSGRWSGRRPGWRPWRIVASVLLGAWLTGGEPRVAAADQFALIVSGASGGDEYAASYDEWRSTIVLALRDRHGFPERQIHVLAERPGANTATASRENVRRVFGSLRAAMADGDRLLVVLIGHGTFDGVDAKFNLVGPDLEAREWATLLGAIPGRIMLFNTTSASFPFLQRVSRRGRVVISATNSSAQRYETIFPEALAEAIGSPSSDLDKNGRLSVWEAFNFASGRVREWYEQRGRLSTERPVLDDNGDGIAKEAGEPGPDGALARQLFFDRRDDLSDSDDPELVELGRRRAALEDEIESLKVEKDALGPEAYEETLARLLIELARVSRRIRERDGPG